MPTKMTAESVAEEIARTWPAKRIAEKDANRARVLSDFGWDLASGLECRAVAFLWLRYGVVRTASMLGSTVRTVDGFACHWRRSPRVMARIRSRLAALIREGALA